MAMGELELQIMCMLWDAESPVPEAALLQDHEDSRKVHNALEELVGRGVIKCSKVAGGAWFSPMVGADELGVQLMQAHIDTFYGGDRLAFLRAWLRISED